MSTTTPPSARLNRNRTIGIVIGVVISVALAIYLLREIDLQEFWHMARGVSVWYVLAALSVYVVLNYFRALRFRALIDDMEGSMLTLFLITMYHNFLVRTLPFRMGEVSYITMSRRHLGQTTNEGLSSLFGARVFEMVPVALGGILGLMLGGGQFEAGNTQTVVLLLVAIVGTVVLIAYAGTFTRWGVMAGAWMVARSPLKESTMMRGLLDKIGELATQLDRMRQPRYAVPTLFYSTLTYIASAAWMLILMVALGVETSFGAMIAIASIAMVAGAIPFSVSGIGVVEGGWALGLVALAGMEVSDAAAAGFFLHGFQLVFAALTGLLGYGVLQLVSRGVEPQPTEEIPQPNR